MPEVHSNQNFACGGCKRKMEEGEEYWVVYRIGYGICCADQEKEE